MYYDCLIIDDEPNIAETTCEYFTIFNLSANFVTSYQDALSFLASNEVALLLLDVNLGDRSGFELCKEIRLKSQVPILFISARTSDDDILTALNIGGDDYITKPFTLNILLAKVKAMLKRTQQINSNQTLFTTSTPTELSVYNNGIRLSLDPNYRLAMVGDRKIKLKEMEYKLLDYMMNHPNTVISKDEFFENVWQDKFLGDGTLTVHIRYLREKIEGNPNDPLWIKTIWGVGYLLETTNHD